MGCRNICHTLKGYRKGHHKFSELGLKTCTICDGYSIRTGEKRCPCCRQIYRVKPHFVHAASKKKKMLVKTVARI